jgi:iron complex outermembrane receptor protein
VTFKFDRARRARSARTALALALLPALTVAQEVEQLDELQEVVVTGSRIRGVEVVGSTSVTVGRELIDTVPAITTTDLMRNVPQVINLGADETHRGVQGGQSNTTFASGVNLRGIGGNTTLLLFDGRRLPPQGGNGSYFDPNLIPTIAVERIEVVADGASAVYGSDAIAGVVNIITRKNFDGVEVRAQYGVGDEYEKYSYSAIAGLGWDWLGGGNLVIAAERSGHPNLRGEDRDFYRSDLRASGGRDYRTNLCNPGNLTVGGQTYALPAGQDGTSLDPSTLVAGTRNLCDDAKFTDLIPDQERNSVMLNVTQRLTDSVEVFTQGYYTDRDFKIRGMLKNSVSRATLTVPNTNPYFISPVPGATSVQVDYLFPREFGISYQDGYDRTYQINGGVTVDLPADWKMTATVGYGRNETLFRDNNLVDQTALNAALRSTDPATALNPFGQGLSTNAAVFDAIRGFSTNYAFNTRRTASLDFDGGLFYMPGGEVRVAAGYDRVYDRHTGKQTNTSKVVTPRDNERTVDSVYAELYVPVVGSGNATRGIESLDLSLAVRYDDYDDMGSTTNPKYGMNWTPMEGVRFKASYGTSFRAPAINALQQEPLLIYQRQLVDPRSPTGFSTGLLYSGGNPDLGPETAKTRSFGVELQPTFLPGARFSLSYFDVKYKDQVVSLYGSAASLLQNDYYSRYIVRNPTRAQIDEFLSIGQVNGTLNPDTVDFLAFTTSQNLSITEAAGFDYEIGYMWDTLVGTFNFGVYGTEFTRYVTAVAQGANVVDQLDTIDNPPKTRFRADLGWENDGWKVSARMTFIGAYDNNLVQPVQRVGSRQVFDLHGSYRFDEGALAGLTIALDVENVLDRDPPFVNQVGGFDAQVSNPIGRLVSLSLRKRW